MTYSVYIRRFRDDGSFRTTNMGSGMTFHEAQKMCERYNEYGYDTWWEVDE